MYKRYVAWRRVKEDGLSGAVKFPYGSVLECRKVRTSVDPERWGEFLFHGEAMVCAAGSDYAHQYFSQDDDGCGLARGKLVKRIRDKLARMDEQHQARWDKIWADQACQRYKRLEDEDYWLWNDAFYNAPLEDLRHIAKLIGLKA